MAVPQPVRWDIPVGKNTSDPFHLFFVPPTELSKRDYRVVLLWNQSPQAEKFTFLSTAGDPDEVVACKVR